MMYTDHRDVMVALAKQNGWGRGIELGLGTGKLFHRLLAETALTMIGVDLGRRPHRKSILEGIETKYNERCFIHFKSTMDAVGLIPDAWADFIFIDAAHGYKAVKQDILLYQPKLRPGGWFGGHDYHPGHPGVVRAVDEVFGDRVGTLDFWIWMAKP